MSEESDDLAQLLAIANEEEEEPDEELTEEELQQAVCSPSAHQYEEDGDDQDNEEDEDDEDNDDDVDNDSTECDEQEMEKGEHQSPGAAVSRSSAGRPEYQFQMQDHHIFKGKHGKKLYKCDVCGAVYRHSFSLKRHFIRSHVNYGYLCETDVTNCGINLSASASLQAWNSREPKKTEVEFPDLYCCHSCVVFFDHLSGLIGHVDGAHRNNKSGTLEPVRIPCSQCNMSFIQRHNLMRHIEVVHQGKKLYMCKFCGRKFQSIADRKRHIKGFHQEELQQNPAKTYQCSKCLLIFDVYSTLKKHTSKKHPESFFPCDFCNKFLFTKKQLTDHVKTRHGKSLKTPGRRVKKQVVGGQNLDQETNSSQLSTSSNTSPSSFSSFTNSSYFHCSLCYRRFLTYGSLIKHKQVAHKPHEKIKSQSSGQTNCSRLSRRTLSQVQMQSESENIQPNLISQVSDGEFYRDIAQRIAENLLHFVDGKFVNCRKNNEEATSTRSSSPKQRVSSRMNSNYHQQQQENKDKSELELNLLKYNFPANFKISSSTSPEPGDKEKIGFLNDCNLQTAPFQFDSMSDGRDEEQDSTNESAYVCSACYCRISPKLFAEHEINNHPNVSCSFMEVDPKKIPIQFLSWDHQRLDGLLHRCPVPPVLPKTEEETSACAGPTLTCTKCSDSFSSVNQLHQHILECAFNKVSTRKKPSQQAISSTNNSSTSTPLASSSSTTSTPIIDQSPPSPCKTRSGKRRQTPEGLQKSSKRNRIDKEGMKSARRDLFESKVGFKDDRDNDKDGNNNNNLLHINGKSKATQMTVQTVIEEIEFVSSQRKLPKRYTCFKCCRKFVYMDTLKKHQLSCCRRKAVLFKTKGCKRLKRMKRMGKKVPVKASQLKIKLKGIFMPKNTELSINHKALENSKCIINRDEVKSSDKNCDAGTHKSNGLVKSISTNCQAPQSNVQVPQTATNNSQQSTNTPMTPLQEHRCPDCLRVFTYMANFRKHIKNVCPVRRQLIEESSETKITEITSSPQTTDVVTIKLEQESVKDDNSVDLQIVGEETTKEVTETTEVKREHGDDDDEVKYVGEERIEDDRDNSNDENGFLDAAKDGDSKLDLWRIKQEHPTYAFKGSPAQHHSCPYCQRGFTYLANYRKHIKSICPIRQQIEERKKKVLEENEDEEGAVKVKPEPLIPQVQYTPTSMSVRSQIEDTVLTMLRDQTKQHEIIQSSEQMLKSRVSNESVKSSSDGAKKDEPAEKEEKNSKAGEQKSSESDKKEPAKAQSTFRFRTFSCSICHKIFLSYVTMLKHRLSHKLTDGSAPTDDRSDSQSRGDTELMLDANQSKEVQNQELAAALLKRSKTSNQTKAPRTLTSIDLSKKINTTDILEKLARGGSGSGSINKLNRDNGAEDPKTTDKSGNSFELIKIVTERPSTSEGADNNIEEIILSNNEISLLKDGIVVQNLPQLVMDADAAEEKFGQVMLDSVDISNGEEVWITFTADGSVITDSGDFVQVPCEDEEDDLDGGGDLSTSNANAKC